MKRVVLGSLAALLLAGGISITWLLTTSSGLSWALTKFVPQLQYTQLTGTALKPISVNGMILQLPSVEVRARDLRLSWSPSAFWQNEIRIEQLEVQGLRVRSKPNTPATESSTGPLPFALVIENLRLTEIAWDNYEAQELQASAELRAGTLKLNQASLTADSVSVDVQGRADVSLAEYGLVDVNYTVSSTLQDQPLHGSGSLRGQWSNLTLEHALEAPHASNLEATITNLQIGEPHWQGKLSFFDTQLPPPGTLDSSLILNGDMTFAGSPVQQDFSGSMQITHPETILHVDLRGDGDRDAIQLQSLTVRSDQGEATGSAAWYWSGDLGWQADLLLSKFNPGLWFDGWTGLVNGKLRAHSQAEAEKPIIVVALSDVSGRLKNQALQASANLTLSESTAVVQHLNASLGTSQVSAKGTVSRSQTMDMEYSLNTNELAQFDKRFKGSLQARGQVNGTWQAPVITAKGALSGFEFAEWSVKQADYDVAVTLADDRSPWRGLINTKQIRHAGKDVSDRAQVELTGLAGGHKLRIETYSEELGALSSTITAAWKNQSWDGEISRLNLTQTRAGDWQLLDSVKFWLSKETQRISKLCLTQYPDSKKGRACIVGENHAQKLSGNIELHQLPIELLTAMGWSALQDRNLAILGTLDGTIDIGSPAQGSRYPTVMANLSVAQGTFSQQILDASQPRSTGTIFRDLTLRLSAERKSELSFSVLLGDGRIGANLTANESPFSPFLGKAKIGGTVDLDAPDVSRFALFLPDGWQLAGSLRSNAQLRGTIDKPALTLNLELLDGALRQPANDLEFTDIQLALDAQQGAIVGITGSARSGAGNLGLKGTIDLSNLKQPRGSLALSGSAIPLVKSPTVNALGDLELALELGEKALRINGDISVSEASVVLGKQQGVVTESNDLVFADQEPESAARAIYADLVVDLGENTSINVSGLRGGLRGKPRILLSPENGLSSIGKVTIVDGKYVAFGQTLDISRGEAFYAGGALDNPVLQVEATRAVNGARVGVSIEGRAEAPSISLFSNPTMPDQDILAMLFFSKRMDQLNKADGLRLLAIARAMRGGNTGDSALTKASNSIASFIGVQTLELEVDAIDNQPSIGVSSQITSALSIGYGYNFVNSLRSLYLRYKINDNWSIQSSIDNESGADFKYQIERN